MIERSRQERIQRSRHSADPMRPTSAALDPTSQPHGNPTEEARLKIKKTD